MCIKKLRDELTIRKQFTDKERLDQYKTEFVNAVSDYRRFLLENQLPLFWFDKNPTFIHSFYSQSLSLEQAIDRKANLLISLLSQKDK